MCKLLSCAIIVLCRRGVNCANCCYVPSLSFVGAVLIVLTFVMCCAVFVLSFTSGIFFNNSQSLGSFKSFSTKLHPTLKQSLYLSVIFLLHVFQTRMNIRFTSVHQIHL